MSKEELFDVTIIGGGPAGLYSAFYSGLREMKTKIIESQPYLGGKVHVYPEKMVWDVGGLLPTPGAKLVEQLTEQAMTFSPETVMNEKIVSMTKNRSGHFVLHTSSGRKHYSKTVITAVGSGILNPQKLDVEGAETFEISNLHYTIKSLQSFKGKTVIISGGGNSAVDWANELEQVAKKVYLTYRKGDLKGHEAQVSQLLESSAECFFHSSISRLQADENQENIDRVELTNHETGEVVEVDVDDVIVNHGFEIDAELLQNSQLHIEMADNMFVSGSINSEASEDGLYAAGDILKHDGKLNLIAGAFQDAANAVNKAKQFVEPEAPAAGLISSHNERFKEKNKKIVKQMMQ